MASKSINSLKLVNFGVGVLVCGLGLWERCLGSGIRCGADEELTWGCGSGIWIRGPILEEDLVHLFGS